MKILIHTHEFFPSQGPCSIRMYSFARVFADRGHQVTILSSEHNLDIKVQNQYDLNNIEIDYCRSSPIKKKNALERLKNNLSFSFFSYRKAQKNKEKYDVIITTSPPPLANIFMYRLAKKHHALLIYDVRDIWPDVALEMNSFSDKSIYYILFEIITNYMFRNADIVTTVSQGKLKKIKTKKIQKEVKLVSNGIMDSFVENQIDTTIIKELKLEETFNIVYIGNVGLAQKTDILLQFAKKMRNKKKYRFFVIGCGKEKTRLVNQAKKDQLSNITFLDPIANNKIYTILKKSHISFVSLKNSNMTDSIPTKIYEALAVGCPIFLIADGDAVELVNEFHMGVVSSCDNDDHFKYFKYMIDNYESLFTEKIRKKAKENVIKKYSRFNIAKEFCIEIEKRRN